MIIGRKKDKEGFPQSYKSIEQYDLNGIIYKIRIGQSDSE